MRQRACPARSVRTMKSDTPPESTGLSTPPVRTLKIEAQGDFWQGLTKPKIRLMGRWLERAGFCPGQHVQVLCLAPGVIELRSPDSRTITEPPQALSEPARSSF